MFAIPVGRVTIVFRNKCRLRMSVKLSTVTIAIEKSCTNINKKTHTKKRYLTREPSGFLVILNR